METVFQTITAKLSESGMTKAQFARAAGIYPQDVNPIIAGKKNISLLTLVNICKALDLELIVK